jgi:hypothetical protein
MPYSDPFQNEVIQVREQANNFVNSLWAEN